MMIRHAKGTVRKIGPSMCGNRSKPGKAPSCCTGTCAAAGLGCRALRRKAAKEICQVDPDYLYVQVSGLHGNQRDLEPNSPGHGQLRGNANGDLFWWKETLLAHKARYGVRAYETWIGKDVLENHDEKSVLGDIPDVWPVPSQKSIDMLMRTSEKKAWAICESIRKGQLTDCSMGVIVGHSLCSICDNRAETEESWCEELKQKKGKFLHADELPRNKRDANRNGMWCYEDNRDIFGIECSWITVGEGADQDAKIRSIIGGNSEPATGPRRGASVLDRWWEQHGRRSMSRA